MPQPSWSKLRFWSYACSASLCTCRMCFSAGHIPSVLPMPAGHLMIGMATFSGSCCAIRLVEVQKKSHRFPATTPQERRPWSFSAVMSSSFGAGLLSSKEPRARTCSERLFARVRQKMHRRDAPLLPLRPCSSEAKEIRRVQKGRGEREGERERELRAFETMARPPRGLASEMRGRQAAASGFDLHEGHTLCSSLKAREASGTCAGPLPGKCRTVSQAGLPNLDRPTLASPPACHLACPSLITPVTEA